MAVQKTAALLHGQRYVWLRHQQLPSDVRAESNILRRLPVPEGTSMAAVRAMVNYLVRRHEGLRTTFHCDTDTDPRQVVHPPAPLSVPTVSTERDGTPSPADVVAELSGTPFELAKEWPIRACVITTGEKATQLVVVLNHMAVDAWSVELLEQELDALRAGLSAGRPTVLRPVRFQPLDLARYEATAAGCHARDRAAAYWRTQLEQVPTDAFASRRDPAAVGASGATLTSPALLDATRRIAERHHVWPSLVHLTAHAQALLAYTGVERVAHLFFAGNRESSACPDVLTCTFCPVLLHVDGRGDPSFGELLQRVARRFADAREHADLPYDELMEALAAQSERRGTPVRIGSELNFLNHRTHRSQARRTVLTRAPVPPAWLESGSDTSFRVYEQRDAVVVALNARTSVMDGEAVSGLLRGYEALLLAQLEPAADRRRAEVEALFGFRPPGPTAHAGTGRAAPARNDAAAAALGVVVGQANGLPVVDPTRSYLAAGGRALRIPRVQHLLAEHRWDGLSFDALLSGRPLAELAGTARWIG